MDYSDVLLTVDFDRTRTGPDSKIPQRNLEAVAFFMENGGTIPVGTKAVCIGSSTARMLKKYGDYDKIIAETFNVDGVVEAILQEVEK